MASLSLLQWIFPTQESNQGLLQFRQILCQLSYQGINPEYSLKEWWWSSSTLATWCEESTHWRIPEKDWRQKKGVPENWMIGWHHWVNGHEFEQTQGDSDDREAWCAAVHRVAKNLKWFSDWTVITTTAKDATYFYILILHLQLYWINWWVLVIFLVVSLWFSKLSCHLQRVTILLSPSQLIFLLFLFLVWLLWLELPILCWIKVERVGLQVLFLIIEEMLSAFHLWVWCSCGLVIIMFRYISSISTLLRVLIINGYWILLKVFLNIMKWLYGF